MENRDRRRNQRRPNKFRKDTKRKKREKPMAKKCPYCESEMKARGASGCSGELSWKCKSRKCGKTVWVKDRPITPPVPLAPVYLTGG